MVTLHFELGEAFGVANDREREAAQWQARFSVAPIRGGSVRRGTAARCARRIVASDELRRAKKAIGQSMGYATAHVSRARYPKNTQPR